MPYKIAGIDVHKKVLMVVVIDATTPEEKPALVPFSTATPVYNNWSEPLRISIVNAP